MCSFCRARSRGPLSRRRRCRGSVGDAARHGRRSERRGDRRRARGRQTSRRRRDARTRARAATRSSPLLEPGRYTIHVESARVRAGQTSATCASAPARTGARSSSRSRRLAETVRRRPRPRERASDPRSDAFATILAQQQIDELPDDPDEMEAGAQRDGRARRGAARQRLPRRPAAAEGADSADSLPPQHVRRRHARAGVRLGRHHDQARPGQLARRDQPRLSRLGAERAQRVRARQRRRAARALRLLAERAALEASTRRCRCRSTAPTRSTRRRSSRRCPRATSPIRSASRTTRSTSPRGWSTRSRKSQMLRAELQRNHTTTENLGVGDFDLAERGYTAGRAPRPCSARRRRARSARRCTTSFRLQWRRQDTPFASDQRGAGRAGAERVQRRRRAARRRARHEPLRRSPTISTSRSGGTRSAPVFSLEPGATAPTSAATPAAHSRSPASTHSRGGTADDVHAQHRRSTR